MGEEEDVYREETKKKRSITRVNTLFVVSLRRVVLEYSRSSSVQRAKSERDFK